ncbi:alpha/beta fold hydrolase [Streptomyces sp. NPDC058257]|uniref:alpha/beta fold hydrolase n=1 Tax=Streptomyces sp. NPDC058257 TaxID=3346409 RepID=UPI0036E519E4
MPEMPEIPDTMPGAARTPSPESTDAALLHELAAALLDLEPLLGTVSERLRVTPPPELGPGSVQALQTALDALAARLRVPALTIVAPCDELWSVELAVSRRLARALGTVPPETVVRADALAVDDAVRILHAAPPGRPVPLLAHDGTPLRGYSADGADAPTVVMVMACGMPVGLAVPWLRALSGTCRVVTWESRGMFAAGDGPGLPALNGHDLAAQAADVLAVLDGFGIGEAHVMGLCGGAAIALAAAAVSPRVTSLSLWHGDYELGGDAPKTTHQHDIGGLLAMAGRSPRHAEGLHRMMRGPRTLDALRPDVAHHLLHPYASPELMYRYGLLNGVIMGTDCRPLLKEVRQPTLVVSSEQDTTAHPEGSVQVAARLPCATLRMMPHGDHLTAFGAEPGLVRLLSDFILDLRETTERDA